MAGLQQIVADLRAESDELEALVAPLPADRWAASTPATGWTIAHQIGHLLWTDRVALRAVTDEPAFAGLPEMAAADPVGFVDAGADALGVTRLPTARLRSVAHIGVRRPAGRRSLMTRRTWTCCTFFRDLRTSSPRSAIATASQPHRRCRRRRCRSA
ncbi:maleylpyruvate isomerase N-terminal domain-containing protein [Candidatus Mycobacterium methanotrophicum]|uniref:maleylpyruvate isomerase N-terminal domain-containing protein n=1 Tax=Candidatus Mycobacterium methanotrophicum TaxID=2943498 RepID=UPI001C582725